MRALYFFLIIGIVACNQSSTNNNDSIQKHPERLSIDESGRASCYYPWCSAERRDPSILEELQFHHLQIHPWKECHRWADWWPSPNHRNLGRKPRIPTGDPSPKEPDRVGLRAAGKLRSSRLLVMKQFRFSTTQYSEEWRPLSSVDSRWRGGRGRNWLGKRSADICSTIWWGRRKIECEDPIQRWSGVNLNCGLRCCSCRTSRSWFRSVGGGIWRLECGLCWPTWRAGYPVEFQWAVDSLSPGSRIYGFSEHPILQLHLLKFKLIR